MDEVREKIAMKASRSSIALNVSLALLKMIAGIVASSEAMLSDAIHSISDVFSTFIVMVGVKFAAVKPDKKHPYGHERFECVASIILAAILASVGAGIGVKGVSGIMTGTYQEAEMPGRLALFAAMVSIAAKEFMYHYMKRVAGKIESGALMADAWHHRTDAMSSIGSFAGILCSRMGYPLGDPFASVIICGFILKAAFDVFLDAIRKMTDEACDEAVAGEMEELIKQQEGVLGIDLLKTRMFGAKIYVDLEIATDGNQTLREAHEIAHAVHDQVEISFPKVKHCMVHVNPYGEETEGMVSIQNQEIHS
ncbi:MAG: cation transporter [Lachnospiraceae bacterium]|nr:cation transporter [Lachnospiraceae bacterium]